MTKIHMNIAGGYMRGEILKRIEDNPQKPVAEVVTEWVDDRYGTWIRANEALGSSVFVIKDVVVQGEGESLRGSFRLDFENPNDEDYFVRHVGGKIIPSDEVPE